MCDAVSLSLVAMVNEWSSSGAREKQKRRARAAQQQVVVHESAISPMKKKRKKKLPKIGARRRRREGERGVVAAAHLSLEAALVGQALEANLVERIGGVAVFDNTKGGEGVVRMGQLIEKKERVAPAT